MGMVNTCSGRDFTDGDENQLEEEFLPATLVVVVHGQSVFDISFPCLPTL